MPIEYDFREQPPLKDEEGDKILSPRIVTKGTIKAGDFIEKVARRITFTTGEVRGILQLMAETMTDSLMEGYSVELEEIGFFRPSLTSGAVKSRRKQQYKDIHEEVF